MNEVCAVIVTYNRKELLLRNIKAILNQSIPADILIYDNASTDGTDALIAEQNYDERVIYHQAKENTGGAGGFSHGTMEAYRRGYQYIWLMDDDGYPLNDRTLQILKEHAEKSSNGSRKAIFNSLVVCDPIEEGGEDTLSFTLFYERNIKQILDKMKENEIIGEISSFNSTFFHRELVAEIGTINADFFIYGDDTDYLIRAERAGYQLITVVDSRYYHPDSQMGYRRVLGKIVAMREMTLRNTYYYARNYMYIVKTYQGKNKAILHAVKVMLKTLHFKENKRKKLQITLKALKDGYYGVFNGWDNTHE